MAGQITGATQHLGRAGAGAEFDDSPVNISSGDASLVLIHPPMPELGLRRLLNKGVVTVGREDSADIPVARGSISRRHAELRHIDGEWEVADMGSTNGTFLNDEEVEDAVLEDGDHVQFGDAIFKFVVGESATYADRVYSATVLDGLTSIYNQRYFFSQLDKLTGRAQQQKSDISVIIIDIDWFADLNEERGDLCGDSVLRAVARRISLQLGASQLAARIGGEEFAVLMPGDELDEALELATAIREAIDGEPFAFEGDDFEVSVSCGVAASAEGELNARQVIDEAQKQLRAAKESGRNRVSP